MKKLLQSLFVLLFIAFNAMAQDRTINGTVTSMEDGIPLPGVSVKAVGAQTVAVTNSEGKYSIRISSSVQSLQFSYLGFLTKTVNITSSGVINVGLSGDTQSLSDVVVVAYGTQKKEALTGSVAQLSKADLEDRPLTNVNSALSGMAPGIQSTAGSGQPGSSGAIRIRGIGSINASSAPLYVVDGVPYDGSIANLNMNDVENVSVLKDASSSALYGSRAANGVVIITTSKGKKGKESLNLALSQGFSTRGIPEYDRVDAFQYYPLAWQAYRNSLVYPASGTGQTPAAAGTAASNAIKGLLGYNPFNVADNAIVGADGSINPDAALKYNDFDWTEPLERLGKRTDFNLNYSGGNEKSDYFASFGYLNDKGYVVRSDYSRYTGRVNVNTTPLSWFKTGLNLSANITKSNQASTGASSYNNIFFFARNIGPIYPVYEHNPNGDFILDANGNKVYDLGAVRGAGGSPGRHVIQETLLNSDLFRRNVISARTYGEVRFLKDFTFTPTISVDVTNNDASTYDNKIVGDGAPGGRATKNAATQTSYTFNQILKYAKTFSKNNIEVLAGHENYNFKYDYLTGSRNTQVLDGNTELGNFTTTSNLNSYLNRYTIESYLSQVNYNYDGKYFLNGSFRADGSSKFSTETRWGNFFSVGGAWLITAEKFMENLSAINYLKLRASYGSVGNDRILDADGNETYYNYQSFYNLNNNNAAEPGLLLNSLPTPNLQWETNYSSDIALEFAMFNNRLRGTIEAFDRRSSNLLFNVPLPVSAGVATISRNVGTMYNRGFEIQLGGDIIKKKDFNWDATLNWSLTRNKITQMPPEQPGIISGTKKLEVGHSIYDYYTRIWAGIDPTDGLSLYVRDPKIAVSNPSQTRIINGVDYTTNQSNALLDYTGDTAIPDFYGSFNNNIRYKNFQFSFLVNYSVGGKVYDSAYASLMSYSASSYGSALHVDALNAWKNPGDNTNVPRLDVVASNNNNVTSSRWLIDASYLSLRTATLSYTLPKEWVSKVDMKNARIYVSGENLFLLSKRKGMDPSYAYTGVTSNNYSPTRTVSIGLNVAF
ncbi:TonB-dependent receptor [Agrobacterium tumefaciens]|nr:TonB-dependent receptor [Agrobacterium tumefaciens]NTE26932.1 TonB-dependent receptor [Agrobacterium tumefaciens]